MYIGYRIKEAVHVRRSDTCAASKNRSAFYEELWRDAATRLGASVEALGDEILEIRRNQEHTRVQQNTTAMDSTIAAAVARNKPLVHKLLSRRGLPTPAHCEFSMGELAKAWTFLEEIGGSCVVKPVDGGGGRGVTTGVKTTFDVIRAAAAASVCGPRLMIEEQLRGDVYRLLYLDGKLLDAVQRKPPTVVADGKSTVRELIRKENRLRLQEGAQLAQALVVVDMDVRCTLKRQGLALQSVPKSGQRVSLKTVINDNSQRDNVSAKRLLCRSIIEDGASAASAVGVRFAGVDVVTADPSVPLLDSGGAILEVNTGPSFHHHYLKRDESYPVALHVLPILLAIGIPEQQITAA